MILACALLQWIILGLAAVAAGCGCFGVYLFFYVTKTPDKGI